MKKLGIAVVGCGGIAQNHGNSITQNPDAKLLYCVDNKPEKAKAYAEKFGCTPLTDYTELFDKPEVDVVHLCTPHFLHAPMAIALLNHGKHVFTEKPMAITVEDAQKMIEAADQNNRYLGVCFQNRLNNSSQLVKEILESNRYGKLLGIKGLVTWDRHGAYYTNSDWRGFYATEGGGSIINQAIHTIDLISYLGGGVTEVCAFAAKFRTTSDYEVDDSCMANFTLKNGQTAVYYSTNCYASNKPASVEIVCEKATLFLDQTCLRIEHEDGTVEETAFETVHGEKAYWGISHVKIIEEFYRCILENRPFFCDGREGIKAIKLINAIKASNGKPIQL